MRLTRRVICLVAEFLGVCRFLSLTSVEFCFVGKLGRAGDGVLDGCIGGVEIWERGAGKRREGSFVLRFWFGVRGVSLV